MKIVVCYYITMHCWWLFNKMW